MPASRGGRPGGRRADESGRRARSRGKPDPGAGADPRRPRLLGTRRIDKPGQRLADDSEITVKGRDHPWVSRGGLKLAHGLDHFSVDPAGLVCLDLGASTGGFTDVLLARGAARVYAVDVGHGQLAWRLRQDPRVVVLERTNARDLGPAEVPEPVGLIVCDVSFIGLATALPAALALAAGDAALVALIKPQFEAGRAQVGKGGVVRDPAVHLAVCDDGRGLARRPARLAGAGRLRKPDHRPVRQRRVPDSRASRA